METVRELVAILGRRLVAYIGSVAHTRTVDKWMSGEEEISEETLERFRVALRFARLVAESNGSTVAALWFSGEKETLPDNVSPATYIRGAHVSLLEPAMRMTYAESVSRGSV